MIPVRQLVSSLRYDLKDMQGVNVSDFELIEVINDAAAMLFTKMAEQYVLAGVKRKILIVDKNGWAMLPSDFVKIHQVGMSDEGIAKPTTYLTKYEGKYRILNDTFYAPEGAYGLEYYYIPARVSTMSEYLDAPQSLALYIEKIALALYEGNLDGAAGIVQVCVNSAAARELSHFENIGPVQVLGGRL